MSASNGMWLKADWPPSTPFQTLSNKDCRAGVRLGKPSVLAADQNPAFVAWATVTASPCRLMDDETLVDAALAGFDQGELVTIPSLEDVDHLIAWETGHLALRSPTFTPARGEPLPIIQWALPTTAVHPRRRFLQILQLLMARC